MLVLFTDTDTDITPEIAEQYGYKLISMPYSVGDKDVYPYEDFTEFDYKSFYDMMRDGAMPSTSALSPAKYREYFEPVFKNVDDILYVHFSAAMTATFDFMHLALKELSELYPERKFYEIDTKSISIGSLNIAKEIGELHKSGKTAEEIIEWANTEVDKFAVYFFAEDLKFFKRSGRVSGLAAIMGGLVGVRPIIYVGADGKMTSIAKEVGRTKAMRRLVSYVEELGDNLKDHKVFIAHSDALEIATELGDMLRERFGDDLDIEYSVVNPTIGSHCGPNCIGVSFHAKHR
jgi:DegV family protein with EDD domain